MRSEHDKQRLEIRLVSVDERGNVVFVEPYAHKIALAVEGGKGVEFEEEQTFYRSTWNIALAEGVDRCISTLHHGEERIAGQEKVDLQGLERATGKVRILTDEGNFRQLL